MLPGGLWMRRRLDQEDDVRTSPCNNSAAGRPPAERQASWDRFADIDTCAIFAHKNKVTE